MRRWTFAELLDEAEQAARALLGNVAPGERLAVWAPNVAECLLTQLGCAMAGIVAVPVPTGVTATELRGILVHSSAAGLALVPAYSACAEQVRAELDGLRAVIDLSRWDGLLAGADPSLPRDPPGPGTPSRSLSASPLLRARRCTSRCRRCGCLPCQLDGRFY